MHKIKAISRGLSNKYKYTPKSELNSSLHKGKLNSKNKEQRGGVRVQCVQGGLVEKPPSTLQ